METPRYCGARMTGVGVHSTDGGTSKDVATVATPTPDKMTETVSLVQSGLTTGACGPPAAAVVPPGRRRRASMQDALDHTKINTSLYDPTLVGRHYNTAAARSVALFYNNNSTLCPNEKWPPKQIARI